MRSWMPNAQMTRAKIREMREAGVGPEMIGFRIGWDWGHARVLNKHSQMMLEQAQLHEEEKKAMLAAWTAHHQMAMLHARNAAALKPGAMVCLLLVGFIAGAFLL